MKKKLSRMLFFLTVLSLLVAGIAGCGSKAPVSENVVTAATATLSSPEDRWATGCPTVTPKWDNWLTWMRL